MNSIGFDLKIARIHFINIENSCDFKQHAINDFNQISHKTQIMGSRKKMKPFANRMKLEPRKTTKEKRKQKKIRIFMLYKCIELVVCVRFFLQFFLRLMDTLIDLLDGLKSKVLIDCAQWAEKSQFQMLCMQRRRRKNFITRNFFSICYLTRYAMPCHAMSHRQAVNIQMKMSSSSSSSFIDSLELKLFASKTFYYVYGFYVITFVKSHLLFRFHLPLYFIQFNLIFCTFSSNTRSRSRSCSRQRWRWQNEKFTFKMNQFN